MKVCNAAGFWDFVGGESLGEARRALPLGQFSVPCLKARRAKHTLLKGLCHVYLLLL